MESTVECNIGLELLLSRYLGNIEDVIRYNGWNVVNLTRDSGQG